MDGRWVSADFFSVFGVKPALGRDFTPGEDERGTVPVVLISQDLWQRKFSASADVLGKSLTLDDKSYTIVGVLPASFNLYRGIDVYVPIGQWNNRALQNRSAALGLHGIGRLKPGVTLEQAQADLARVMRDLADRLSRYQPRPRRESDPAEGNAGWRCPGDPVDAAGRGWVRAADRVRQRQQSLACAFDRQDARIRDSRGAGCRPVAFAPSDADREYAAGTNWRRCWDCCLPAGGREPRSRVLPTTLPRAAEIGLDGRVLLFTLAISLLTGILSGLAPALKTSHWRLSETLKEGGRGAGGGRHRAQGILVAVEMALALVLFIGAGLMIRSINALWNVDPGFRAGKRVDVWTPFSALDGGRPTRRRFVPPCASSVTNSARCHGVQRGFILDGRSSASKRRRPVLLARWSAKAREHQ